MSVQRLGQPLIIHCTQTPQPGSGIIGIMQFCISGLAPFFLRKASLAFWVPLLCVIQQCCDLVPDEILTTWILFPKQENISEESVTYRWCALWGPALFLFISSPIIAWNRQWEQLNILSVSYTSGTVLGNLWILKLIFKTTACRKCYNPIEQMRKLRIRELRQLAKGIELN
jgi:hypothetical protein